MPWLTSTQTEVSIHVDIPCICAAFLSCFRYEDILLQQDPLPAYGLKLLLALLEQHPAFIRCFNVLLINY